MNNHFWVNGRISKICLSPSNLLHEPQRNHISTTWAGTNTDVRALACHDFSIASRWYIRPFWMRAWKNCFLSLAMHTRTTFGWLEASWDRKRCVVEKTGRLSVPQSEIYRHKVCIVTAQPRYRSSSISLKRSPVICHRICPGQWWHYEFVSLRPSIAPWNVSWNW